MEISIQMFAKDLPWPLCSGSFSACSLSGRHAQQYLNRIIDPKVGLLFVTPYNVVQEVISSFSRNDNTLILIVPAVNRGIPNFSTLRCHSKKQRAQQRFRFHFIICCEEQVIHK